MSCERNLTVIVPAYNEAKGLRVVLPVLVEACRERGWGVVVVDDCSTDDTRLVAEEQWPAVTVLHNDLNLGYGGSIKRGVAAASTDWVATFDADGQHRVEDLLRLADRAGGPDAVVGRRVGGSHVNLSRVPGKWLLARIVKLIVGERLPDINCGLRVFRRRALLRIAGLTSDRFSFSTSTLVALLKTGHNVVYEPVRAEARVGKSQVRQIRDGLQTIMLVLRLVVLFEPFRVFLPLAAGCVAAGMGYQVWSVLAKGWDVNDLTVLLWLSGIVVFVLALVADQIASLRKDLTLQTAQAEEEDDSD
jgi:glycosyltransferase involved in cell wall biosynthesis